ncbi:MAG TPA: hypothetical protein VKB80_32435 [Kofleriaceae bacterium]|nr:hypothetical protein [Kofleriaceae bacterium]
MAIVSKASFRLSIGAAIALAAGGTTLVASRSADGGPKHGSHKDHKEAAVQDDLLPYQKVAPPEVIKRDYVNMRVTPYNDPKFYFEVTVPTSFQNQPVKVSPQQLKEDSASPVPMAEFAPRDGRKVLIEARYVRVPEKVTLERFMAVYVEQSGFEFVKRLRGEFEGRQVEDALVRVKSPELGQTLTRITVSRRGDLVFIVAGSCPEDDYAKWKQAFAVAAISFSPTGK